MRSKLLTLLLSAFIAIPATHVLTAQTASVNSRLTTQNALFEDLYQSDLKNAPERATAYGDYRYNDQLSNHSLAAIARRHTEDVAFITRLKAIPTTGFSEQDTLSHDLLVRVLQQRLSDYELKEYEMPVDQMNGVHTSLADLPLGMPFDSVKHYEDYIARLHQIPRVLSQTTEVLRAGMKDNLMPVRFLLEKIPGQCNGIIAANPFLIPTKKFPSSISPQDQKRLTAEITDAVNKDVIPAYRSFAAFVATDYAPHGRTKLAVTSLPDGVRRYQNDILARTTTHLTPDQIHAIGLKEVTRITAEMTTLAHKAGFKDLASFRESINKDPKWVPTSSEQILNDYRHYIAQMQPKLPQLFTFIPGSPVTVEALPAFQAANSTHYQTGTPDGKRPGRVSVATSDFAHRTLLEDEAVAYHEGIPGHHMQQSVQQQLKGLPRFRLHTGFSAYTEGWALYAEQLGKEVGFYQDPVSDYGRLNSELFRAVRLVVDTGIHAQGWSRDQVVDYMRKNDLNEPLIQSETDRYIAWPAQACSYKLGQLKILDLRERAKKQLGAKFDIRTFNDEILSGGSLPLDMLDTRVTQWTAVQKSNPNHIAGAGVPATSN
ncbi:MAG: DUF885 domain-containing protein [Edaphobacter sp.]